MSLRKISHKRMQEEKERGFDIITHGAVQGGLAKLDESSFMKKEPSVWAKLERTEQKCNQGLNSAALNLEGSSFADRTQRLGQLEQRFTQTIKAPSDKEKPASHASRSQVTASGRSIRSGGF
jgi:hypothetical protein